MVVETCGVANILNPHCVDPASGVASTDGPTQTSNGFKFVFGISRTNAIAEPDGTCIESHGSI